MKPNPEEVAEYLKQHSEFFEQYADLLAEIFIPHPHGGRAIAISERQIVTLREKNKQLESKLGELIRFGEENDAIGEKVHRMCLALIRAQDLDSLLDAVYYNLREDFAVPHAAIRIWGANQPSLPECGQVSGELKLFAESLANPSCGARAMFESADWFGEDGPRLRSFAFVPLRGSQTLGLLALASEDPQRFYPEMGTLYLKRLGDLITAALARHLE